VEHDVRHHPVVPLTTEKGPKLRTPPFGIGMREADRDEGRIPVPLEGIDARSGLDEEARVVSSEDLDCSGGERFDGRHHGAPSVDL
jgi:hypothetical protein